MQIYTSVNESKIWCDASLIIYLYMLPFTLKNPPTPKKQWAKYCSVFSPLILQCGYIGIRSDVCGNLLVW